MARLILVRHGQIAANVTSHWHGSTDSPLTDVGREQAAQVAARLRARAAERGQAPVAVYTSPLERTRHTAEAIAAALGLQAEHEHDLREYGIGELEGTHYRTLMDEHRFFAQVEADHHFAPPGGESVAAVAQRVLDALHRLEARHRGAELVVVGHGAALGVALGTIFDGNPTRWTHYGIRNCSITELELHPTPRLLALNDVTHLQ